MKKILDDLMVTNKDWQMEREEYEYIFMNVISEAGFKVIKSQSIDTKVSGTYKVITVSR